MSEKASLRLQSRELSRITRPLPGAGCRVPGAPSFVFSSEGWETSNLDRRGTGEPGRTGRVGSVPFENILFRYALVQSDGGEN
jgi:hypothetical protein